MTKWKCDAPATEHTVYKSVPRLSNDGKCTMDPNSLRSKRTMNNIRSKRDTTVFLHTSYLYKSACKTTTCCAMIYLPTSNQSFGNFFQVIQVKHHRCLCQAQLCLTLGIHRGHHEASPTRQQDVIIELSVAFPSDWQFQGC